MDHKLYLTDPGIFKKKTSFYYHKNNKLVTDSVTLKRISNLHPPPAWISVWYASNKDCHIQVHGIDAGGKKQYILSENYINESRSEKYKNMKKFIKDLDSFKKKIKLPIKLPIKIKNIDRQTLIFLLFNLLIDTHIRVGNEIYAETNKTYGLTTLRQKHLINIDGVYKFVFTGKSKIDHTITIPPEYNKFMERLILPHKNKLLFWYDSPKQFITSEDLNNFLKENMGTEFTCKDFRTYSANVLFIKFFLKNSKKIKENKIKIILKSIDETAKQLGHTRTISRKSYISNNLIDYCLNSDENAASFSSKALLCKIWSV